MSLLYVQHAVVNFAPVEDIHFALSQRRLFPFDPVHEKKFSGITELRRLREKNRDRLQPKMHLLHLFLYVSYDCDYCFLHGYSTHW